ARGLIVIKPSGVAYEHMRAQDLVVVDLDGHVVEGELRPSSDTETHLALYRAFQEIGGVVHTHSTWATAFAQAEKSVPLLGTTHADFAPLAVPVARHLRRGQS
ncbi:MAG: class II aldolase/adducin family protein, partial [Actinomycetota bacterium]|nr:class II aldolase/adducin family protein [Actinomycetota bacterium]